jgi:3-hydroxymyristoyl/3-hydroxydecanoyl-(acyl carrier protein) dehydratase
MVTVSLQIPTEHPAFAGHFPGMPIVPGALLLDETVRVLGAAAGQDGLHCEIATAKFLSVVHPGETLTLEHERGADGWVRFVMRALDRPVLSGRLTWLASLEGRGT